MNMTKLALSIGFILFTGYLHAQTITSNQDGPWNATSTWVGGIIPTNTNSSAIVINHNVSIPNGYSVTIDGLTLNSQVTINAGGTLDFLSEASPGFAQNYINGTLVREDLSNLTGTTGNNLVFESGSIYRHLFTTTQGAIPLASWNINSTVQIEGYTSYSFSSAAGNWSQSFGNVVWDCTAQTNTFNMNGLLTSIAGNFRVINTGTAVLQMATTQNPTISIGGDLSIENTARVRLTTTGGAPGTIYDITGSFIYTSTNATGSDVTTSGVCTLNIGTDFSMNAPGGLLAISRNGAGVLNIGNNFDLVSGTLSEIGVGSGDINFVDPGIDHTFLNTGTISDVSLLNYTIPAGHSLRLIGESQLLGGTSSSLTVSGTLIVESENSTGAIITGAFDGLGNVRVEDRIFNTNSRIVYGGAAPQFIGDGHPSTPDVDAEINNASGVSLELGTPTSLTLGRDLYITTGNLNVANDDLIISRNVYLTGGDISLTTTTNIRTLQVDGDIGLTGGNINLNSGDADAILVVNGTISGGNYIFFNGDNCNLQIGGSGSLGMDFPLFGATAVETITVDRAGETIVFAQDLTTLDITIDNGAVDMNAPLVVFDDLNLATGTTLYIEGQTLELRSQFNNTLTGGVISSDASSSLSILDAGILGTLAFSPTGNTLGSFTLNRATTGTLVTLNSSVTVLTTFNLADGIVDNISGLTFGNGTNVTRNSAASFTGTSAVPAGGPYNLAFTGGTMTTGAEARGSLNNVTCSAGTITLAAAITASGTFSVTSGTFTSGANTVNVGSLTISGGTFNAPSSTLTVSGDVTNSGTFNRNNGTIIFAGTSSILGTSNPSFQNVSISGTLTSPATFNVHGAFTNNGTFNAGTGTVAFLGTAAVTQVVSGSSVTAFNNISVANSTAATDVRFENSHTVRGTLSITANAVVDADGTTGTGILTLLSTDDDPAVDAAIAALSGTSQVTGNVTVQRYMSIEGGNNSPSFNNGRIYRYISSPVQNATVQDIQAEIPITGSFTGTSVCSGCGTSQSMFLYNESVITDINGSGANDVNDGYQDFPLNANTETFTTGRGYTLFIRGNMPPISTRGNARWDVRNPINSGTVNFTTFMSYTSSGVDANDGWNLVGNPYPSTIDWNAAAGWTKTGLDNTIYMIDNSVNPPVYATFNGTLGTNGGSRYIPMGQAFFVKANSGAFTFSCAETVKSPGSATIFFREAAPENVLRITLRQGVYRDETVIHFREDATEQFDNHADAFKLMNSSFNVSTMLGNDKRLSINSLPALSCQNTIKLDVSNIEEGHYRLDFSELESFTKGIALSLTDKFTNAQVSIKELRSYEFDVTSDVHSYGSERFYISISPASEPAYTLAHESRICKGENVVIKINGSQGGNDYAVTMRGQPDEVIRQRSNGGILELTIPNDKVLVGENVFTISEQNASCATSLSSVEVTVFVEEIQPATITVGEKNVLTSNYEAGNTWYFDGTIIGEEKAVNISESGEYTLEVVTGACILVSKQNIFAEDLQSDFGGYRVYPNPVAKGKLLKIESKQLISNELHITNAFGVQIGKIAMIPYDQGYLGEFDLGKFPTGIYFVTLRSGNTIKKVKVLSLE